MSKTIVIVVSAFGLGHLTRQIALKNALLELDDTLKIIFVCTEYQDSLLRRSILTSENVRIEFLPLTPVMYMRNWAELDIETTIDSYRKSWEFETQIRDDVEWGRILQGADIIINDIECIHNPIARKMDIPIINISNFTWSDILSAIGSFDLAEAYASWEKLATYHFRLPLHTDCIGMVNPTPVNLLCRQTDADHVDKIRSITSKPIVYITYSRMKWEFELTEICKLLHENGYKIMIPQRFAQEFEEFTPITIRTDEPNTQNYVAAADIILGKAGYGIVSEVLTTGKPFIHWIRQGFYEDKVLSDYLLRKDQGRLIDPDIHSEELLSIINEYSVKKYEPEASGTKEIAQAVLNILHSKG